MKKMLCALINIDFKFKVIRHRKLKVLIKKKIFIQKKNSKINGHITYFVIVFLQVCIVFKMIYSSYGKIIIHESIKNI